MSDYEKRCNDNKFTASRVVLINLKKDMVCVISQVWRNFLAIPSKTKAEKIKEMKLEPIARSHVDAYQRENSTWT